ncbi:MAG: hypothetical protein ACXVZ1_08440, partial [Gaiellaceae bacterium]
VEQAPRLSIESHSPSLAGAASARESIGRSRSPPAGHRRLGQDQKADQDDHDAAAACESGPKAHPRIFTVQATRDAELDLRRSGHS